MKIEVSKEGLSQRNQTKWLSLKEAWLAQCWVDASEDSCKGNSQKYVLLWATIYNKFNNNPNGWQRGDDQLSSKWRNINQACGAFQGAYNKAKRNWRSGDNDQGVEDQAHQIYANNNKGKRFIMMDVWRVLSNKSK
ncbi:glutathione S-transferase T3-like [Rutidosis leptorrhynchoides]|uniref:glutathione S-transferase T3-like n=1 Tax=Rutidosis leptorrhynchoides TaxID=125765 RepID=UPI003A99686E